MIDQQEFHLPIKHQKILLDVVESATSLSRVRCKELLSKGVVWLERKQNIRRVRKAKTNLLVNDTVHIYYSPDIINAEVKSARLIVDEGDFSVWYKPKGMYSQGSKWGDHCTLYRWAETHLQPQRNAFIVHRLDRATDGLMLLAHSKKVAANLSQQFAQRETEKHYRAIIEGIFPHQHVTINTDIEGKTAISEVRLLAVDQKLQQSTLEINIKTGRKHQIRRHLSKYGYPIVGDRLYGNKDSNKDLQLTAVFLTFNHPETSERLEYQL